MLSQNKSLSSKRVHSLIFSPNIPILFQYVNTRLHLSYKPKTHIKNKEDFKNRKPTLMRLVLEIES